MLLGAAGTKARALWLSTVLLAGVRGVHPPPDKCCDGPARPVLWISLSNTSALAAACHLSALSPQAAATDVQDYRYHGRVFQSAENKI